MNNQDHNRKINDNSEDKILSITSDFKNRRLQILQDPTNLVPRKEKQQRGTQTWLGSGMTTCSKLLLGRTNRPRLHYFLQRTDAVHPRRKSAAQRDNMEQRRLAGIYLPKTDVMLDMVLICTRQSQDRRRGSTQNYQMKEQSPHHKTSSNYCHVHPGTLLLWDQSTSNPYHKSSSSYDKTYKELQNAHRGCSTSQTTIFMTIETSEQASKRSTNQNSTLGGYLQTEGAVHMDQEHQ